MKVTERVIATKKISGVVIEHQDGQDPEYAEFAIHTDNIEGLNDMLSWGEFGSSEETPAEEK